MEHTHAGTLGLIRTAAMLLAAACMTACAHAAPAGDAAAAAGEAAAPARGERVLHPVEWMRRDASRVQAEAMCDDTRRFAIAVAWLPSWEDRAMFRLRDDLMEGPPAGLAVLVTPEAHAGLDDAGKAQYVEALIPAADLYETRVGSPLVYTRAVDLLCAYFEHRALLDDQEAHAEDQGESQASERVGAHDEHPEGWHLRGRSLLDLGQSNPVALRMLASLSMDVTGVALAEHALAPVLFVQEGDQGAIDPSGLNESDRPQGSLTLRRERWPAEADLGPSQEREPVDIVLAVNSLAGSRSNAPAIAAAAHQALREGGVLLIWNVAGKRLQPEMGGVPVLPEVATCAIPREALESAGFVVKEYDTDDTEAARALARALGWDSRNNPVLVDDPTFRAGFTLAVKGR